MLVSTQQRYMQVALDIGFHMYGFIAFILIWFCKVIISTMFYKSHLFVRLAEIIVRWGISVLWIYCLLVALLV